MHTVQLPAQFRITAINKFTSQLLDAAGRPISSEVTLDFDRLNFIDGSGYTVLSNSIGYLLSKNVKIYFQNHKKLNRPAIQYLDDCGFFTRYLKSPLSSASSVRSTTIPCQPIDHAQGFSWIENKLGPWLGYALRVPQTQLASVRTCVKEVWNNIADHSSVATGFAHAQHYPNVHEVKITLSDFGIGIPATIRAVYGNMTDEDAIFHATRDGVTARSQKNNMGSGLSYLVDTILAKRGKVRIHSRNGNVTFMCDSKDRPIHIKRRSGGPYPGTLVEIELDTRLFIGDEDERGDFEWY